jgi:hemerythrin
MEHITWTNDFSVGVATIDEQHRRLIEMINRLVKESQATTQSETVSDLLTEMTKYAQEHFATEEDLMQQYNYPDLEEHVDQHRAFKKTTANLCRATMCDFETVPETMLRYLCDWLKKHILETDMAYKPFFREQGLE